MVRSLENWVPLVDVELSRVILSLLLSDQPPDKQDMAGTPVKALLEDVLDRPKISLAACSRLGFGS